VVEQITQVSDEAELEPAVAGGDGGDADEESKVE